MTIEFRRNDEQDRTNGKIARAKLKFDEIKYGPMGGCALEGFTLWEPTDGTNTPRVTLPARVYSINGQRRRYDLVRAIDVEGSTQPLRDAIAAAWLRIGEKTGEIEMEAID